jgi:hypothetical protein
MVHRQSFLSHKPRRCESLERFQKSVAVDLGAPEMEVGRCQRRDIGVPRLKMTTTQIRLGPFVTFVISFLSIASVTVHFAGSARIV